MLTKKSTLLISGAISIVLLIINYFGTFKFCDNSLDCNEFLSNVLHTLFIFIPIFVFSTIAYNTKESTFQYWFKFVRLWIPITIFLVIISPSYGYGLLSIEKSSISFLFSFLFLLISLIIIITKSLSSKK